MSPDSMAFFLGLLVCSLALYRYFGGQAHACLFCGTRSGEHDESCPWRQKD